MKSNTCDHPKTINIAERLINFIRKTYFSLRKSIIKKIEVSLTTSEGRSFIANILVIPAIFAGIYAYNEGSGELLVLSIVLLIIAGNISQGILNNYINTLIKITLVATAILILNAWVNKGTFVGMEITDMSMMIVLTAIYVYFTYGIINSNKNLFEMSRCPSLVFDLKSNLGTNSSISFYVKNVSKDILARDVDIILQINYPKLNSMNPFEIIRWYRQMAKNKIILSYPHIAPNSSKKEDISHELKMRLNRFQVPKYLSFKIDMKCTYTSDLISKYIHANQVFPVGLSINRGNLNISSIGVSNYYSKLVDIDD